MRKIIAFCLTGIMLMTMFGCSDSQVDLSSIDFDTGTLDIDTSGIEEYVKNGGYTNYTFHFDVDKSIYSCEIYLSEAESAAISIDGMGYDTFIADARNFLSQGTKLMSEVLAENELSGISAGMFIASNDNVVYCVALDGSITYIAHTNSDAITSEKLKEDIANIANSALNDQVTVSVISTEKEIVVIYDGIKAQTQESVNSAATGVRAYLDSILLSDYIIRVVGPDDQPVAVDHPPKTDEDATKKSNDIGGAAAIDSDGSESLDTPIIPKYDILGYNHVGQTFGSNYPVFELQTTEQTASSTATSAIEIISQTIKDTPFFVYAVDENEKYLGMGGSTVAYSNFEFSETYPAFNEPPFTVPFKFYFFKYFNDIECRQFTFDESITYDGANLMYKFFIDAVDPADRDKCLNAATKIVELMSLTLGEQYEIVVIVYEGTSNEIYVTSRPQTNPEN